jgi:5S rRNA maturation endonuclease (ribonuclease M5)
MIYRNVNLNVLTKLAEFIDELNYESEDGSIIVVEGKRDLQALLSIGFVGEVTTYNKFKGIMDFVDNYSMTDKKIILLLDMDRTGKYITSKLVFHLHQRGSNVNLWYKRKLCQITNGRVRHIEDLVAYRDLIADESLKNYA